MNAVDDSCFDMYKSKNDIEKIEDYKYNCFAPIYIASGITKNNEVTRDFGGKAEQGSLIISKYKIKEHYNQFYYNDYKYEFDATEFRKKDWCRSIQNAIIEVDGKEIQIINVHGIWNKDKVGDERTIMQSQFILNKIRYDIPAIITGDFNLLPDTSSIKLLNNKNRNVKLEAIRWLANIGSRASSSVEELKKLTKDEDKEISASAILALKQIIR